MLQLNIGQTYYSKYYVDRIEVEIKAVFDDRVVYRNKSRNMDKEFVVTSIELFNDSYVSDFNDLKIKRLNKQIVDVTLYINNLEWDLADFKTKLAELEAKNV